MSQLKWTPEMRIELYSRLTREFGPHREWNAKIEPKGKKEQFDKVMDELAQKFSRTTGKHITAEAVHNQLNWATTTQKEIKDQSHVRNFMLNKVAALEAGFILSSELPTYMNIRTEKAAVCLDEFAGFF